MQFVSSKQTSIRMYGEKSLILYNLCHTIRWISTTADPPLPILGADFLAHFCLHMDVVNHKLIDSNTNLCIIGIQASTSSFSPIYAMADTSSAYTSLLAELPNLS